MEEKLSAMTRYIFGLFDTDWGLVTYVIYGRDVLLKKSAPNLGAPCTAFHSAVADARYPRVIPRQHPALAAALFAGAVPPATETEILRPIKHGSSRPSDTVLRRADARLKGKFFWTF